MPESMSRWGDLIAPALSTTRSAATVNTFPPLSASTPTALPSWITIFRTNTPPPHRQVQIVAHRLEMRERHAHAHAVQVVRGRHAKARGVGAIRIRRGANPACTQAVWKACWMAGQGPLPAPDG